MTIIPRYPAYSGGVTYTPLVSNLGKSIGQGVAVLGGQAAGAYALIQAHRPIDQVLAVGDILAATFAATPIGPYLAISQLLKGLTVMGVDRMRANQERNSIERGINAARARYKSAAASGLPEAYAQYRQLLALGPLAADYGDWRGIKALRANPFYRPGAFRRGRAGGVRDPLTGEQISEQEVRVRYGDKFVQQLADKVNRELQSRRALGAGFVPPLLATYRRAA